MYMYSLSDTSCTNNKISSASTDDNPETTTKATSNTAASPVVTKATSNTATPPVLTNTHGQVITVIMTSQPAHAKTSDSTGLIAAVISAVIVLLGIVIVLVVIVLLVKKRYSNE